MVLILFIVYVPVTVQINKKLRSESFNLTRFKHQPRLLFYFGRNSSGSMQSSCTLRSYIHNIHKTEKTKGAKRIGTLSKDDDDDSENKGKK